MTINRNLSILAEGASSSGVLGTANGGTGLTAVGTSGNVLTSNGSAWTSVAPSGGGAMTLISTQTASSSASISWTGLSGYDKYFLIVNSVSLNSGASLLLEFGYGASPTYFTSGYSNELLDIYNGGTATGFSPSSYVMLSGLQGVNNPSLISGNAQFSGFNNTSAYPSCQSIFSYNTTTPDSGLDIASGSYGSTGNIITAIKLYATSNNINSGTASLYGISS